MHARFDWRHSHGLDWRAYVVGRYSYTDLLFIIGGLILAIVYNMINERGVHFDYPGGERRR